MSKIEVPQELKEKIINMYVNEGKTRKAIRIELNTPFGDSVIKRILQEENIKIRTNSGAQKGGRKASPVAPNIVNEIIQRYKQGQSMQNIVDELHLPFSTDKIHTILLANNVYIRKPKDYIKDVINKTEYRKYLVNDNYNIDSHNGAWLLGFIAADGYLPISKGARNRVVINLARKDEDVLHLIAKEIGFTGKIRQYDSSNGYPSSSLAFASRPIRQQIEKYGIGNNKTFKLKHLPQIPKKYMIDFIRGYFDGDGSVYEPGDYRKIRTNIVGASANFLQEIINFLHENYGLRKVKLHSTERVHTIYDFSYSTKDSFKFCNIMYNNSYLALPRKKEHYLNILKKYSLDINSHEPKAPKGTKDMLN